MSGLVPISHTRPERLGEISWRKGDKAGFLETRWSLVSRAGEEGEPGDAALEELCRLAWFPLFSFARRMGWSEEDAEDAVQVFLASACQKGIFAAARRERGKLRTFLLVAFKRSLLDERRYRAAGRRGGGQATISLGEQGMEELIQQQHHENESPDRIYHRQWALGVMEAALAALETEYAETGRIAVFKVLVEGLEGEMLPGGYTMAAAQLGMTENAVRQTMYRLRLAFRREVTRRVALSLGSLDEAEITRDLGALREALAPG